MKRVKTTTSVLAAGIAALSFGIAAQGAYADDFSDEPRAITVSFKELDLSKEAGAAVLYKRIRNAARSVCNEPLKDVVPAVKWRYRECVQRAIDDAVAQVNRPALAKLHREKTARAG